MYLKHYLLSVGLGILATTNLSSQTPERHLTHFQATPVTISIDDIAMNILLQSPGFTSDLYSLKSLQANLKTASNLPDPEIGGEYLVMPEDVDNRWTAEVSWGVEWPGVYGARNRESKIKMSAADKAVYSQRIDKLAEIKDLLLDYAQCRQKCQILEKLNKDNETIYQIAQETIKGGEMTVLDLNKIKIEYTNIKGAQASLIEEEAEIIASLSAIYGKDCSDLVQAMDCRFPDISIPTETDMSLIKTNAPSLQAAAAEADVLRQSKKVSKMEAFPSLSVGYKHQYEDGMHFNGAVLGISIPIFSSRGKQKAANAEIMEADYKVETTAMTIETEANSVLKRLKLLKWQIDEISPLVESIDYEPILLKAYQEGILSLLDYITERNYFANAAVELVSLRYSAAKAQIQLSKYFQTYNF